jgi:hypothetical protein
MSSRQDGGNVDNSNSDDVDDMDVSYDFDLNLSTNLEPTSLKKVSSHDECKEAMHKEYDVLINNETWKLVDPPFGTKPIGCKWVFKNKYISYGSLDKHKARLMAKGFEQKEGVDYEETFSPTTKMGYHPYSIFHGSTKWMENSSNGCEDCFLEWRLERECVHVSTRRICCEGTRT